MVRNATNSIDKDDAPPATRSGALSRLLRILFVRQARSKRMDGEPALPPGKAGASIQDRRGKPAAPSDNAMLIELSDLFNAAPGSREALRHLAAVRHGLKHKDSKG